MVFENTRRKWHEEKFKYHYGKIAELVDVRASYDVQGRKAMVLAVNYELASHATRALTAFRKAEELGAQLLTDHSDVRAYLSRYVELPAVPRSEVDAAPQEKIDSLYHQFEVEQGREPSEWLTDATRAEKESDRPANDDAEKPSEAALQAIRDQLEETGRKRLEEFDANTALLLVSKLRAELRAEGPEVDGLTLQNRPMPVDEQIRLMRLIFCGVGHPFDGRSWYYLMIATWLNMNAKYERGDLNFSYEEAVQRYRMIAQQKDMPSSTLAEAAFANMQGAIYSLITAEPYDFSPPN